MDNTLIQASEYLMTTAHSFRLQKKNFIQILSKKNKTSTEILKPNRASILIAKNFPSWQAIVMTMLFELYQVEL